MTKTETLTLTDFLLARIAEDERVARRATHQKVAGPSHGSWHAESLMLTETGLDTLERRHVARFDPARVLAECETKREVLRLLTDAYTASVSVDTIEISEYVYQDVLRALALPYVDHPDYRDEWRP